MSQTIGAADGARLSLDEVVSLSARVPWPLPDGLDFMSYHTLRILHDSQQALPIPHHDKFRPSGPGRYSVGAN